MRQRVHAGLIAPMLWLALGVIPAAVLAPAAYAGAEGALATDAPAGRASLAGRAAAQPAAWHDSNRLFAAVPIARTPEEIRAMRIKRRHRPPSDPVLACYLTDHIATRCPQTERP